MVTGFATSTYLAGWIYRATGLTSLKPSSVEIESSDPLFHFSVLWALGKIIKDLHR